VFPADGNVTLIVPEDPECARQGVVQGTKIPIDVVGGSQFRLGGLASGVVGTVKHLSTGGPVGLVNAEEVMCAGDYRTIEGALSAPLRDAGELFERVRSRKSGEEMASLREANAIAESVLEAMRSCLRAGVPERDVASEGYRAAFSRGTSDTLFLLTCGKNGLCGRCGRSPTGKAPFEEGDVVSFSIELDGPDGYFVEFARPLCLGEPQLATREQYDVLASAFEFGEGLLKPGVRAAAVHGAVREYVSAHGYRVNVSYTGHGIGQDIMERPFLHSADDWTLEEGMTVAFHPQILDGSGSRGAYMADVCLVTPGGGEPLSRVPLRPQVL
jgi:Xaa-Pro aminopeptidase